VTFTNCRKVKIENERGIGTLDLEEGWVGVKDGQLFFRPTRGSNGFSIYSTEKAALNHTQCPRAMKVALKLHVLQND
jgi:hypothetical protein